MAFSRASMVVTYYIKLFRTGADRHNSILMSLLLLVAETITKYFTERKIVLKNLTQLWHASKNTNFKSIPGEHSIFITPENLRKPLAFWRFQGVYKLNITVKWLKVLQKRREKLHDLNFPASIYWLKVNNKNTKTGCEICAKLTHFTHCSSVFLVNFE